MTKSKFTIILKPKARSRNGCLNCKRAKRKCDESSPTCGLCAKRKLSCEYEIFRTAKIKASLQHHQSSLLQNVNSLHGNNDTDELMASPNNKLSVVDPRQLNHSSVLFPEPASSLNIYLDNAGIQFLQYFEETVSKLLTVDLKFNYFSKTFLQLSLTEESVSHALAAWGGIFKSTKGFDDSKVQEHYHKSLVLFQQPKSSNISLYITLCFNLIIIGIKVCAGDVDQWYKILKSCGNLISRTGGVYSVLEKFNFANEASWLIMNFQYHDILNSKAFVDGTFLPIDESSMKFTCNYGLDPFQGCHHLVLLVLGEILNERKFLPYCTLQETLAKYKQLENKLNNCRPSIEAIDLENDKSDKYMKNFHLYTIIVRIILMDYFKRTIPSNLDVQIATIEGMELIHELISVNSFACVTLPFLILGVHVINNERLVFLELLDTVLEKYNVGNLRRVRTIVRIYWQRNNGDLYLDWVDIVKELNWNLCMC